MDGKVRQDSLQFDNVPAYPIFTKYKKKQPVSISSEGMLVVASSLPHLHRTKECDVDSWYRTEHPTPWCYSFSINPLSPHYLLNFFHPNCHFQELFNNVLKKTWVKKLLTLKLKTDACMRWFFLCKNLLVLKRHQIHFFLIQEKRGCLKDLLKKMNFPRY